MSPNLNPITEAGQAIFVEWEKLDALAQNWAHRYFPNNGELKVSVEREGLSFSLLMQNLSDEDYEKYKALFTAYDDSGDYDASEEFDTVSSYLPGTVSMHILAPLCENQCGGVFGAGDTLPASFDLHTAVATEHGVFFMERVVRPGYFQTI